MRSLSVVTLLLASFISLAAQNTVKPAEASKVDEFNDARSDYNALVEKAHAFLDKLAAQPRSVRGVVIVYPEFQVRCISFNEMWKVNDELDAFISRIVKLRTDITSDRIVIVRGHADFQRSSAEFWMVPDGAPAPQPRVIEFDPGHCCPTVTLVGPTKTSRSTGKISFFVYLRPVSFSDGLKYEWKVTGGTIVSGQGSDEIVVDISKLISPSLTVSVSFSSREWACPESSSLTIPILN